MGGLLHLVQRGPGRAGAPPSPLLAVPNVTAHLSTASVPITVLLYDRPLHSGCNVGIKGLICRFMRWFDISHRRCFLKLLLNMESCVFVSSAITAAVTSW